MLRQVLLVVRRQRQQREVERLGAGHELARDPRRVVQQRGGRRWPVVDRERLAPIQLPQPAKEETTYTLYQGPCCPCSSHSKVCCGSDMLNIMARTRCLYAICMRGGLALHLT